MQNCEFHLFCCCVVVVVVVVVWGHYFSDRRCPPRARTPVAACDDLTNAHAPARRQRGNDTEQSIGRSCCRAVDPLDLVKMTQRIRWVLFYDVSFRCVPRYFFLILYFFLFVLYILIKFHPTDPLGLSRWTLPTFLKNPEIKEKAKEK